MYAYCVARYCMCSNIVTSKCTRQTGQKLWPLKIIIVIVVPIGHLVFSSPISLVRRMPDSLVCW